LKITRAIVQRSNGCAASGSYDAKFHGAQAHYRNATSEQRTPSTHQPGAHRALGERNGIQRGSGGRERHTRIPIPAPKTTRTLKQGLGKKKRAERERERGGELTIRKKASAKPLLVGSNLKGKARKVPTGEG